jgi:hypothetical protein
VAAQARRRAAQLTIRHAQDVLDEVDRVDVERMDRDDA